MKDRIPLSESALVEIKEFALRFSKKFEKRSSIRIRGVQLYDAFVQIAGYDSFNQAKNQTGRVTQDFDFESYYERAFKILSEGLPLYIEPESVKTALTESKSPGYIGLMVNFCDCSEASYEEFFGSDAYNTFKASQALTQSGRFPVAFQEIKQSRDSLLKPLKPQTEAVSIYIDYSCWLNETDPMDEDIRWQTFFADIAQDLLPTGRVEITKQDRKGRGSKLTGFRNNQFQWALLKPKIKRAGGASEVDDNYLPELPDGRQLLQQHILKWLRQQKSHPMQKAIDAIPELTDFGVGLYNRRNIPIHERESAMIAGQEELKKYASTFRLVTEWLKQNIEKRKTINQAHTSYGLKHLVESKLETYIPNGVFIAAAIYAGFDFKTYPDFPNVKFNMSEKSIMKFSNQETV